jgi:cysteine desulfurase / selenocysteine lyase
LNPVDKTCPSSIRTPAGGAFDPEAIRLDFPALQQTVRGYPLVYLDNAATTQKPASVIRGECEYYGTCNANVHRAIHYLGEEATRRYEEVRRDTARFIGAASEREIVFTRGTTEGINLVAQAWGRKQLRAGDAILLTEMEHHSNLIPWQLLAKQTGAELRFIPVKEDGMLDLAALPRLLEDGHVRLAAFTHVSNALGTVNPVREIAEAARAAGARVLVDGAQSIPHQPVDVRELGCDFLAFSAHKMCGPTGVGVLYGRADLLEEMDPYQGGGEMISRVEWDSATWADIPHKFEAGTPNIAGVFGFGAALQYWEAMDRPGAAAWERELTEYGIAKLEEMDGVRLVGRPPERYGVLSFTVEGIHPHDLAQVLDREGIAIRAGHLCAQPLLRKFGLPAVNRASLYFYNLKREIDALTAAISTARSYFRHGS